MKFFIKHFFSKCDQIRRKLRIWSHLLKKSLMKNFIFYVVSLYQFYKDLTRKTYIFEGYSWFNFTNLGLKTSMALKLYKSVAKVLKLKVRNFDGCFLRL